MDIGTEVRATESGGMAAGKEGVIIGYSGDAGCWLVEFKDFTGGHWGSGTDLDRGRKGRKGASNCYFLSSHNLIEIKPPEMYPLY